MVFFFLFIVTITSRFPLSDSFRDKLNQKEPTEAKYQNLNFLIFHPIIIQYFGGQNDHYYELLIDHEKCLLFYFKKGCKGAQIAKFLYLKYIFNTWNTKTRQMSMSPAYYGVQHITEYCVKQKKLMGNLHCMCVNFYIQYFRAIHRCCDIRAQVNQPIRAESMFQSKNNSTQEVLC